jgi:hypothetical protein
MTRSLLLPLTIAAAISLAGCAKTSTGHCDGWKPIRPTQSDIATMSDALVEQLLAHNKHGETTCAWKP